MTQLLNLLKNVQTINDPQWSNGKVLDSCLRPRGFDANYPVVQYKQPWAICLPTLCSGQLNLLSSVGRKVSSLRDVGGRIEA